MQKQFLKFDKVWFCDNYSYPAIVWNNKKDNRITIYKYASGMWSRIETNPSKLYLRDVDISENILYYRKKALEC